jgi:stage V sporulation protein G
MTIDLVTITLYANEKLKAFATIVIDHCFVIRGLKVIEGREGLFVAMPNRPKPGGGYQDIAHPITHEARAMVEDAVLSAYARALAAAKSISPDAGQGPRACVTRAF